MARSTAKKILGQPRSLDKIEVVKEKKVGYEYLPRQKKWKELKAHV